MPQAKTNLFCLRLAAAGGVRGAKHTLSFLSLLFFFFRFQLYELDHQNQWRIILAWPLFLQGNPPLNF
ncbi:hypothetical protein Peur_060569 [Populus x canadensis]